MYDVNKDRVRTLKKTLTGHEHGNEHEYVHLCVMSLSVSVFIFMFIIKCVFCHAYYKNFLFLFSHGQHLPFIAKTV